MLSVTLISALMTAVLQAVALGAAVQAGILEGQVSDVMVLDVWQANLMRAFARQRLQQDGELAAQAGLEPDQLAGDPDDQVGTKAICILFWSLQDVALSDNEVAMKPCSEVRKDIV